MSSVEKMVAALRRIKWLPAANLEDIEAELTDCVMSGAMANELSVEVEHVWYDYGWFGWRRREMERWGLRNSNSARVK
jgi:hypothetical protein